MRDTAEASGCESPVRMDWFYRRGHSAFHTVKVFCSLHRIIGGPKGAAPRPQLGCREGESSGGLRQVDLSRSGVVSCDEYPFATTDQGGAKVLPPNSGFAWVPVTERQSQSGLITAFYRSARVLSGPDETGDAFWVAV